MLMSYMAKMCKISQEMHKTYQKIKASIIQEMEELIVRRTNISKWSSENNREIMLDHGNTWWNFP